MDIARVIAERDIARLLAEYCRLCDDGEFDALIERFTEDGEFEFAGRVVRGRADLRAWFAKTQSPQRRGKHLTANAIIDVDATGERAVVVSDYVFLAKSEGRLVPVLTGTYRDELRCSAGRWQISRREASAI